jgi:hypothetical protein
MDLNSSTSPSSSASAPASAPSSAPSSQNNPSSSGYNPFAPRTNSASEPTPATPATQPETAPATQPVTQPAAVQPTTQQTAPVVPLTQEQFQQTLQAVMQQNRPQAQQPAQPQLTEQEFRQKFNIFSVTPETYEGIFGVAPSDQRQVAALDTALQGVARQAVTMARFLMEQQMGELRTSISPLQEAHAAQRESQLKQTFFSKHADLKDYEPLVREVTLAMQKEGHQFQSPEQAMEQVAARSRSILQNMKIAPSAAPSAPAANAGAQRMAPLSTGGRSGSSVGSTTPQTTAAKLFGNMKR